MKFIVSKGYVQEANSWIKFYHGMKKNKNLVNKMLLNISNKFFLLYFIVIKKELCIGIIVNYLKTFRDLTLESLLLDGTNEIKINGFGIAKKIEPNEWLT